MSDEAVTPVEPQVPTPEPTPEPVPTPEPEPTPDPLDNLADLLLGMAVGADDDDDDDAGGDTPDAGTGAEGEQVSPPSDAAGPTGTPPPTGSPAEPEPVDWNKPENQKTLQDFYARQRASEESEAAQKAKVAEFEKLIEDEDAEEVGRRIIQQYREAKVLGDASGAARQQYMNNVYETLYSDPAIQEMSPEEKETINPNKFEWDGKGDWSVSYIAHVQAKIAERKLSKTVDEQVEERVQERLKAKGYAETGNRVRSPSATDIPPAGQGGGTPDDSKSGADLIFEGLRESIGTRD